MRGHGDNAVDSGLIGIAPPLGSEMKGTHEGGETHGEIASSYPALQAYDAETDVILEQMRVFYSRFNPAKARQVNNSKQAKVDRT